MTIPTPTNDLAHLDRTGRLTARLMLRPAGMTYLMMILFIVAAWLLLVTMAARTAAVLPATSAGPGMAMLAGLGERPLPPFLERLLLLCLQPAPIGAAGIGDIAALTLMWFAMACAMMLPSAAPLLRTYCEIADTARGRGMEVVHPLVLVWGHLAAWFAAAIVAAALSLAIASLMAAGRGFAEPLHGAAGGIILLLAALYQVSPMRAACLRRCRNPFAILFARWSTRPARIFRLGVEQGLWCAGCCWALMLMMFVVGLMNVFWMALVAAFTLMEKQFDSPAIGRSSSAIMLVWGLALLVVSV